MLAALLALQPMTFALPPAMISVPTDPARRNAAPPAMLERKVLRDGKFVKETVDDEKVAFTARRLVIFQIAAAVPVVLALASGKSVDQYNAPGYGEVAAKKQKEKEAYLAGEKARMEALRAKTIADRAANRPQSAPPKPWER